MFVRGSGGPSGRSPTIRNQLSRLVNFALPFWVHVHLTEARIKRDQALCPANWVYELLLRATKGGYEVDFRATCPGAYAADRAGQTKQRIVYCDRRFATGVGLLR